MVSEAYRYYQTEDGPMDLEQIDYISEDDWEVADRFVTTLDEHKPSYWEVSNDDCDA